jgi:hypothetical protein
MMFSRPYRYRLNDIARVQLGFPEELEKLFTLAPPAWLSQRP